MKTYPTLRMPKPRSGLKVHRWWPLVVTRPTIARDGRLVRRVTFLLRSSGFLYRQVPPALPIKRRA
jgi:hypothetical protein